MKTHETKNLADSPHTKNAKKKKLKVIFGWAYLRILTVTCRNLSWQLV